MTADKLNALAELRHVLDPHQLFPPSREERDAAIGQVKPILGTAARGIRPREDQLPLLD